jgi:hypothetical protein
MARFSSYDARKLMIPAIIIRIAIQFHLQAERSEANSVWDFLVLLWTWEKCRDGADDPAIS